jgi:large subunit ribosomal protein L31
MNFMKKEIHPKYYPEAKATCACGAIFLVGSTLPEIKVEICSQCHPLYTGNEKIMDTAGRVERFNKRRFAHRATAKGAVAKNKK